MKQRAIAVLVIAAFGLAGCSNDAVSSVTSSDSLPVDTKCIQTIQAVSNANQVLPGFGVNALGENVDVLNTDRIVTLSSGSAEVVWAMGFADELVGIDLSSIFPNSENRVVVNPGHEPALETILGLKPTLVIADASVENEEVIEALNDVGIQVVMIPQAQNISEIDARINSIATALGVFDSGSLLMEALSEALTENQKTSQEKSIAFLYLRGSAGVYLLGGKDSGADSIIAALGATDVGVELGIEGFAPLTAEALAVANPDIILVMNNGVASVGGVDKLLSLPGVSTTTAGKTRSIIQADDRVLLSFGLQTGGLISCLSKQMSALQTSV